MNGGNSWYFFLMIVKIGKLLGKMKNWIKNKEQNGKFIVVVNGWVPYSGFYFQTK